jgi:uncharacterized membrane protein YbhN (UPF0104 family)
MDYFAFEEVSVNWVLLVVSTLFLWAGYVLSTISWWNILQKHKIKSSISHSVISHGLAIFAKYIPGKIWVILGRAGYIANMGHSLKTTSFLSLKEQLIYVWEGLLISAVPMMFIYGVNEMTLLVLSLCLFFTFFLYSRIFHNWFLLLFKKITKKELDVPFLKFTENLGVIIYVFVYWVFWLVGFYVFVVAFYPDTNLQVAFAFPLSVTLGLLAIIFPGGLGVREGIMGSYLVMTGIPLQIATVITLYARVWFISGEVFIFLFALLLKIGNRDKNA